MKIYSILRKFFKVPRGPARGPATDYPMTVHYRPIIERSRTVLSYPASRDFEWSDVLLALMASTGRTPVQILCTGRFTPKDEYCLNFSEGTKEPYEIPCLVSANSVERGLRWLGLIYKRIDPRAVAPERAIDTRFHDHFDYSWKLLFLDSLDIDMDQINPYSLSVFYALYVAERETEPETRDRTIKRVHDLLYGPFETSENMDMVRGYVDKYRVID